MRETLDASETSLQKSSATFLPAFFDVSPPRYTTYETEALPSHLEVCSPLGVGLASADPRFKNRLDVVRYYTRNLGPLAATVTGTEIQQDRVVHTVYVNPGIILAHRAILAAVRVPPALHESQRLPLRPRIVSTLEQEPLAEGHTLYCAELAILVAHPEYDSSWIVADTIAFDRSQL